MRILTIAFLAALATPAPAGAQQPPAAAKEPAPQQRIAELEAALARQTTVAENARQQAEAARAEAKLKDELLLLARQRNAEMYAIAEEVAHKVLRRKDLNLYLQYDRVRLENLKQDYEDRLRAARVLESTLPPSVQQRMEAEIGTGEASPAPAGPNN